MYAEREATVSFRSDSTPIHLTPPLFQKKANAAASKQNGMLYLNFLQLTDTFTSSSTTGLSISDRGV